MTIGKSLLASVAFRHTTVVKCHDDCGAQLVIDDQVTGSTSVDAISLNRAAERRKRAIIAAGWASFSGTVCCPRCWTRRERELTDSAKKQWRWEQREALRIERVG